MTQATKITNVSLFKHYHLHAYQQNLILVSKPPRHLSISTNQIQIQMYANHTHFSMFPFSTIKTSPETNYSAPQQTQFINSTTENTRKDPICRYD